MLKINYTSHDKMGPIDFVDAILTVHNISVNADGSGLVGYLISNADGVAIETVSIPMAFNDESAYKQQALDYAKGIFNIVL